MNPEAPRPPPRRTALLAAAALLLVLVGYGLGAYSLARNLWPLDLLREWRRDALLAGHVFDAKARLVAAPGKTAVPCPPQDAGTAVLLVIGQSNAANHGAVRHTTAFPDRVVNLHAGHCTVAASPLLGATGAGGEFTTLLADALVRDGSARRVVLLAAAVAESPVSRWQADADLNLDLLATLREAAAAGYRVTHIAWHQGESDAMQQTTAAVYARSFVSLRESLAGIGISAPIFVAVATRCGPSPAWLADNPTARGQRALVDDRAVFLGADTDALLGPADRAGDACHFSASGQRRTAEAFAQAVGRHAALPR